MRRVPSTELGQPLYRKRSQNVEPLFGNTKHNNGVYRLHRRGRMKVRTEWRLLMMTHILGKLHRYQLAAAGSEPALRRHHRSVTTDNATERAPSRPRARAAPTVCATASTTSRRVE
jgi:hypothetical protein